MNYTPVIGLEVHVELKTQSKMFCGCSADYFGKEPNSYTCPVCLGLPGALPVPNKKAIDWCVMIGLALNCEIPLFSKFDRKNYFYPDLAKGYQISQYDEPFCINGYIDVEMDKDSKETKRIRIRRVHMEEDTGKLLHEGAATLIDFNRSGVPLVEIVTEPDFENTHQVVQYLKKLQQIVRYLDVSNADMEKGDMRLEPNISLKKPEEKGLPPYKVEVKNINSFRFVDKAIAYEIKRHEELLTDGQTPSQETRGWDEKKQKTVSQRSKEEAMDYRYFPEPDIPPIAWKEADITTLKNTMPELPDIKTARFQKDYSLSAYDATILTREKEMADFFEKTVKTAKDVTPKQIANYLINDLKLLLTQQAKDILETVRAKYHKSEMNENELQTVIDDVLKNNAKLVAEYKNGKVQVLGPLLGMTKAKLGNNADMEQIKKALEKALS